MDRSRKERWWVLIIAIAIALVTVTFTPVIIRPGKMYPKLFSLPYTLWTSMLITILLVVLTYLGSRVRDFHDDDK